MSDYSAVAPPPTQNQSSAFAAALQRARQIAAKINPTSASNPDIKLKRSLEDGSEPEAKKLAPDPLLGLRGQAGLGDPSGGLRGPPQASSPPHGIGAGLGGNCVEDIRVPDKMVGLIIGRGGEQITRLQSETGCKIQMAPESGGLPDRVCTLTGSREAVNRAKERVLSIVNDRCRAEGLGESNMGGSSNSSGSGSIGGGGSSSVGGGGGGSGQMMSGHPGSVEIMIPGPKVGLIIGKGGETIKQLQEKSGAKMVVIQDGPSQEQEKPLRITGDPQKVEYAKNLVYELIAEKEMQMFQRGGPRGGSERSNSFSNDNGFNHGGAGGGGGGSGGGASPDGVEVLVPRAAVGVVIGKGGDMIKKIQSETGARVQFQQGREDGPGDRKCLLSGKPQAVEQARQKIQELIDSVIRRDDRNPMGGGRGGGAPGGAGGNGGGPRGNGFGAGRPNEYGGWDRRNSGGSMENKIETTYKVPSTKCGIIIGKGGETIKQINQQTGAHCELDRNNQNFDNNEKTFIIRGTPEQVEHAKRIFTEKLGGGGGGMGGAPYGGGGGGQGAIGYNPSWNPNSGYQTWPNQGQPNDGSNPAQQVQMNPQTGQPDYSAQWVEYYRSLGMHREAEIIEQQSKQVKTEHPQQQQQQQQQPAPPGSAGGVAGQQPQAAQQQPQAQQVAAQNGAQADYSAQWAEYYRSMGKIQEAEAIEAQMKSGKMGTPGNQMAQSQMQQPQQQQQQQQQQQKIQGQPGNPTAPATPNAFPQAYGTYPGMNPGGGPGGYYPTGGANAGGNNSAQQQQQQQPGQQNPNFGGGMGYQNYPYSQQNSDN